MPKRNEWPTTASTPTTTPTPRLPEGLAARIANAPRHHDDFDPLWAGPCGAGPMGGVTQSMLVRFLSCRDRFRLKYLHGLEPHDKWVKTIGYGNLWHAAEEVLAAGTGDPLDALFKHAEAQAIKYPLQRNDIWKWYNVARVQFPEYVNYWRGHPDVVNRVPLMQEQVFDVPYRLPSGRVVRLRGKFDSVDLIDGGIYLQENKTKGDIDKEQVERQLRFDLQTMLYLTALTNPVNGISSYATNGHHPVRGVRYNVVRRPLSGGIGNIKPHAAKFTKTKTTPAETDEEFYERLRRDYIATDPGHWFFRVRAEITEQDMAIFRDACLNPLLENLCWWYDDVTDQHPVNSQGVYQYEPPPANYRTPFGVWSALEEGGSTEYDAYYATGSEAGLYRVRTMFSELQ